MYGHSWLPNLRSVIYRYVVFAVRRNARESQNKCIIDQWKWSDWAKGIRLINQRWKWLSRIIQNWKQWSDWISPTISTQWLQRLLITASQRNSACGRYASNVYRRCLYVRSSSVGACAGDGERLSEETIWTQRFISFTLRVGLRDIKANIIVPSPL